jgi:hypothetical protein
MKKLLALALVAVMSGSALADDTPNSVTIFFDGDTYTDARLTNSEVLTTSGWSGPFQYAYLVLMNPIDDIQLIEFAVKSEAWVEGWMTPTLFGPEPNYVTSAEALPEGGYSAQFAWPNTAFPATETMVMARWRLLNWAPEFSELILCPIIHLPPTFPGKVGLVIDGAMYGAEIAIAPEDVSPEGCGTVATFFGNGVIATEDHTLSSVKGLFR